jgi:hypothetical protein
MSYPTNGLHRLVVVVVTVVGLIALRSAEAGSFPASGEARQLELQGRTVEVSMTSIDPGEISRPVRPDSQVAVVTVQIFHSRLSTDGSVVLEAGTAKTEPPGSLSVGYEPANQVLRLRAGEAGRLTATVRLSRLRVISDSEGKLVVTAILSRPSAGVTIVNNDPSAASHQATLIVRRGSGIDVSPQVMGSAHAASVIGFPEPHCLIEVLRLIRQRAFGELLHDRCRPNV